MIDFLGIGAQKAGTTWLTENLRSHPQIWIPQVAKEVHYFDVLHLDKGREHKLKQLNKRCAKMLDKMQKSGLTNVKKEHYLQRVVDPDFAFTDDWYAHIFSVAPAGKVCGEYTPLYCAINSDGINHVKRLMPEVKLIYIIRDPVQRSLSSLRMALERGSMRSQEDILSDHIFQARGDYAGNIPAWEKVFSVDQILYLPFGRIKTDPLAILREVEVFLGLTPLENYPLIKEQIHRSAKKGEVNIEPESINLISSLTASQYPFLEKRFGNDFVAQIA